MKLKVTVRSHGSTEPVHISSDFIKLDSFLKFAMIAESGGMAKSMIADGEVKVNGEVCLQRGKKLYPGDRVAVLGQIYAVAAVSPDDEL